MPSHHRSRLQGAASPPGLAAGYVLPAPRHWLLWALVLSCVVIALGLTARLVPDITAVELTVDELVSTQHQPALTTLALVLNVLFSPVAGAVIQRRSSDRR